MCDYNWNDPYLTLYATIISAQRASKNQLKENFIDLRKYSGWNIVEVEKEKILSAVGSKASKIGQELHWNQYVYDIMNAKQIDYHAANKLKNQKKGSGKPLTLSDQHSYDRYWIEKFYHEPVTPILLAQDNKGKYREQIKNLEGVLAVDSSKSKTNKTDKDREHENLSKLFEVTGLLDTAGVWNTNHALTNALLKPFVTYCSKNKTKIEKWVNIDVRKDIFSKPVAQLNKFLHVCGLEIKKTKQYANGDQKIYEYMLDSNTLIEIMAIIETRRKHKLDIEIDETEVLWHLPD